MPLLLVLPQRIGIGFPPVRAGRPEHPCRLSRPPRPRAHSVPAAFNASSGPGEVSFTSPTVVEWRFSPPLAEQATPQGDEARNEDAGRRPRRWLLRRLTGFGGSGGGDLDNHRAAALKKSPERSGSGGGRSMRYVAVVLPVGPGCTKIFARWVCTVRLCGLGLL